MTGRLRVAIRGAVQGVGFRPFIYRLAKELGLAGWVLNSAQGVFVEVEGPSAALEAFLLRIEPERPPQSFIQALEPTWLDPAGYAGFTIRESDDAGAKSVLIMPDLATCPDCLRELFDPNDRRYRYPFINCTHCGPRLSIVERLPYDRPNTTMKRFAMCPACLAEYEDPLDRRFHAQPNACPVCGPHLELWDSAGDTIAERTDALRRAEDALRAGKVVAVKGIGGFHLMVDARDATAVAELRLRKRREEKPFALLYPSLDAVRRDCEVSELEARALASPQSPIMLLRKRPLPPAPSPEGKGVSIGGREAQGGAPAPDTRSPAPVEGVAPGNPYLGVMLPYAPLHHLLMADIGFPVVATSGNLSDEPICIDERDALERLRGIADLFLVHDRPIARHVDDSIVRVLAGREAVMRRARGYAPLPVSVPESLPPILAVGAHLKNTVAISVDRHVIVSQHIGDLETAQANEAFRRVIADFRDLYEHEPEAVACDLHPDYLSTHYARRSGKPVVAVQHHYAHALACMAENNIARPFLAVSWDGTGYGADGTVWGGEFLRVTDDGFERVVHLRQFPLPGGEAAVREPRRSAAGLLWAILGEAGLDREGLPLRRAFTEAERTAIRSALRAGVNAPLTSSAGRLFDGIACIAGLRDVSRYEGQAAMELEACIDRAVSAAYPFVLRTDHSPAVLDWEPMIGEMLRDAVDGAPARAISACFHRTLVAMIVRVAAWSGLERVALTGGCFQNAFLTEEAFSALGAAGHRVYRHQRIPPNDGGIALGQLLEAARQLRQP